MILDHGDRRDFLHGTLSGELHRLPLRSCIAGGHHGSDDEECEPNARYETVLL